MALPALLRRRKPEPIKAEPVDDIAFRKAMDGVAKAFLSGNAAKMPGTSWSNQGSINNALLARVTQNLASSFNRAPAELEAALAEHGLSWGPPFPPGRPLDPFWGYRRPPRTWDFAVGENVQLVPRWNRISFGTLKAIIDSYYAAQIAVRHLINDVRSLDFQFIPPQNVLEDATEDIALAEQFFASPDKRQPFRTWLAEYLQDVLRYDAGALYVRRNEAGEPIALEVVSGATLIPLVDFFGRPPADEDDTNADPEGIWQGSVTPGFVQIIEGLPWVWLAADDIIYQRLNPLPESQYGLAPMEAVLIQANTDIRFQWHFLQYFTEGTIPAGFMEAPPDLSDPIQVQEWQETWDAVMLGDQSKLNQVRWVPAGAKFTEVKPTTFDKEFPLYLMRCTAAAFGVTANDLGFTEDVNRATGEVQVDVQFRVGTLPVVRFVEDVINQFILENLKLKARIQFDTGQGTAHRLEIAQANDLYIKNGTLSSDEVRITLGKRISREVPMPRVIDNTRGGPVPLLAVHSLAGKVDPTTYGPAKEQEFIDHPFMSAPGALPVIGSQEYKDAQNSTAMMQQNMLMESEDPRSKNQVRPAMQPPMVTKPHTGDGPTQPKNVQKDALGEAYALIDHLLDRLGVSKDGASVDNMGGPGVTRGFSNPTTVTGGLMVDTGLQGVDLMGPEVEDDDEEVEKVLRQWRENSLNRVKKGLAPRRFEDVPFARADPIWERLHSARSREEVIAAFAPAGKVVAPTGA